MHEYKAKMLRIVDGDTVDVDIDLGFGVWLKKQRIRLYGIDTPESRTRDKVEKMYGMAAKAFVQDNLKKADKLRLRTHKDAKGKFGRILGEFILESNGGDLINLNKKTYLKDNNIKKYTDHGATTPQLWRIKDGK